MGMNGVGIKKEEGGVRHLSRERNEVLINLICTGSKKRKKKKSKEKGKAKNHLPDHKKKKKNRAKIRMTITAIMIMN